MVNRQLDEEAIFHFARRVENPPMRSDYLQQICGDNTALLARVQALLEVHEKEADFLRWAESELAPTLDAEQITERPGMEIGRYRLMEEIGEGGLGVVFVAEQRQPLKRKIALKVIKPGMDSKAVVARFEAERQALALMDHPNIAHVLDAGSTATGRPYFVMEYVRGIAITDYCDKNRLTIRERVELFVQACQAIQHAHQKGIVHRDIKPSNVLVTLNDGKCVPKVIDFGVAKALNTRLTDQTIYTAHMQVIGTLMYMSPEQAEMSGLDIDTRSEVYSLGVLLYELLTGTTPFLKKDLDQAGFDEQRRIIREQEPPRASLRISSLGETATTIAEHRETDTKRLNHQIRGDLDWIVMKALEKDRTRRYATANAFAVDVQRFLSNEPIEARPPSKSYLLRKFISRNRKAVVVTTITIPALAAGVAGISTGLHQTLAANRELELKNAQLAASEARLSAAFEKETRAKEEAVAARTDMAREIYRSRMKEVENAHEEGNFERMFQLLGSLAPWLQDDPGVRGFSWWFWLRRAERLQAAAAGSHESCSHHGGADGTRIACCFNDPPNGLKDDSGHATDRSFAIFSNLFMFRPAILAARRLRHVIRGAAFLHRELLGECKPA